MLDRKIFEDVLFRGDSSDLEQICKQTKNPIFILENENNIFHCLNQLVDSNKLQILGYFYPELINRANNDLEYPIHKLVENGNLELIKAFVDIGASVSARNKRGYNCLHLAVSKELADLTAYFCTLVDPNTLTRDEISASSSLHIASYKNNLSIMKILMKYNADVNVIDKNNETALHIASVMGHVEIVKYLIFCQIKVNQQNNDGNTALHLAIKNYQVDVVKILLKSKININLSNSEGESSLVLALRKRGELKVLCDSTKSANGKEKFDKINRICKSMKKFNDSFRQKIQNFMNKEKKTNTRNKEEQGFVFKGLTRIRSCF